MFKNAHFQTVFAILIPIIGKLKFTTHPLQLSDGDVINYHFSNDVSQDKIAILLHGLAGSANSPYIIRLAKKLNRTGYCVARLEFRNYGKAYAKAKHLPHAGRSEDALACIQALHQKYPKAEITVIGFSMGANVALKTAGEYSELLKQCNVKKILAIAPPINLSKCADLLDKPGNKLYRYCFMRSLNKMIANRHKIFPELGLAIKYPLNTGMRKFDDSYTARYSEFKDAKDYYQTCSSISVIQNIEINTQIFVSIDDPFIDKTAFETIKSHPKITYTAWPFGGHIGCLGNPFKKSGLFWMHAEIIKALTSDSCT